ncbi:MAG: dTMP kinase [Pseudomonadota bacterium]
MERGLFITLEGSEGAGKSSAMEYLTAALQAASVDLLPTREPGGTKLGERLREILLNTYDVPITPMSELLMIFAARAQHVEQVIRPALLEGHWVLCDRFTDASYAYQGGGRSLGEGPVRALEDLVQGSLRPDVTILLDVPVEVGLERARGRGELDRFEQEDLAFFERVRQSYLSHARRGTGRYRVIDASRDIDEVQAQLKALINELVDCPPVLESW